MADLPPRKKIKTKKGKYYVCIVNMFHVEDLKG
jgi:hypothetical protein